jgi:hypothetical protein
MSNEISPPVFNRTLGQSADRHPDKNRTDTDTPYRGLSECLTGPSRLPLEERHKSINKGMGVSIPMAKHYERTNRHGRRYLSGRLGDARIFVVATGEESKGNAVWLSLNEGRFTDGRRHAPCPRGSSQERLMPKRLRDAGNFLRSTRAHPRGTAYGKITAR